MGLDTMDPTLCRLGKEPTAEYIRRSRRNTSTISAMIFGPSQKEQTISYKLEPEHDIRESRYVSRNKNSFVREKYVSSSTVCELRWSGGALFRRAVADSWLPFQKCCPSGALWLPLLINTGLPRRPLQMRMNDSLLQRVILLLQDLLREMQRY